MSAIEAMLRQPGAQAVGWALLHFVWQGGLVAVSTAAALALLRRSAADVRYVVSAIALSVMLTLPAVTAMQTWRSFGTTGLKAGATEMVLEEPDQDEDRINEDVCWMVVMHYQRLAAKYPA